VAVQLAKQMGAYVIATCSGRNAALVKSLGADEVVDYTTVDFATAVSPLVDVVYDSIGGFDHYNRSIGLIKPGGAFVTIVGDKQGNMSVGKLVEAGVKTIERSWPVTDIRYRLYTIAPNGEQTKILGALMASGELRTVVDSTYPLADAVQAFARIMSGRAAGKVIVEVKPEAL